MNGGISAWVSPMCVPASKLVRMAIGGSFVVAASLTGYRLATQPMLGRGLLDSRWFLMGVLELELLAGILLVSSILPKLKIGEVWNLSVSHDEGARLKVGSSTLRIKPALCNFGLTSADAHFSRAEASIANLGPHAIVLPLRKAHAAARPLPTRRTRAPWLPEKRPRSLSLWRRGSFPRHLNESSLYSARKGLAKRRVTCWRAWAINSS